MAGLDFACTNWPSSFGTDFSCFGGPGTTGNPGETDALLSIPGAMGRGGSWFNAEGAGPFAVDANEHPSDYSISIGFRCGR